MSAANPAPAGVPVAGGTPPVRVLELAADGGGIASAYAGWLLVRLGAEVERVADVPGTREEANGSVQADSPIALALQALAMGKQRVDLPADALADELARRLAHCDVLVCDTPRALERLLGPLADLRRRFPRLVIGVASVFGGSGPYADLPATGLDAQAISAVAWSLGEAGRAPLTLPPGILEHQSGAMLAAGCLLALADRNAGRPAQHVDVALSDVLASYVAGNCRFYIHHGLAWQRSGRRASGSGGAYPFVILPCKDGEVCICGRTRDEWNRLVQAMGSPDWAAQPRYQDLRAMGKQYPDEVDALMRPWLARHTMAELEAIALQHNLIVSPIRGFREVLQTTRFSESGFLEAGTLAGRTATLPGVPWRVTSRRSPDAPDRSASLLAAHDDCAAASGAAVSGAATSRAATSRAATSGAATPGAATPGAAARAPDATASPTQPLAGMRVLDMGWVWSAPWVGTMLAELGAQVIKVEHALRPDNLRLSGKVIRDGRVVEGPSKEMSPMYHQINHGKLGITLNAKAPRAVALIRQLAAISDVVVENMSPGSMDRQQLGYDVLRTVNPRLVMLSMSTAGQFGELASMRAYAPTMSSFVGLEALVGYRGEAPIGALNFALADPNASVHGLLVLLAAWRRARATGEGCYIDFSQIASLLGTLRPYLLQAQCEGRQPAPLGNAHPDWAPHGIYPAAGDDAWLTLAVTDAAQWHALCALAGDAPWSADPRFASNASRRAQRDALDDAIAAWTRVQPRDALVTRLRAAGIAASPVLSIDEQWRDPHYAARAIKSPVTIPFYGEEPVFRAPWRFSEASPRIERAGPRLGEHNELVFGELLGLPADEIEALKASGVIA